MLCLGQGVVDVSAQIPKDIDLFIVCIALNSFMLWVLYRDYS